MSDRLDLTYVICLTVALICIVIGIIANITMFDTIYRMNDAIKELAKTQDETTQTCVQLQNQIDLLDDNYANIMKSK